LIRAAAVLDPSTWPTDQDEKILYGDTEVALLARTVEMDASIF